MNIEKGRISVSQLFFVVAGYIQGAVISIPFMPQIARQDSWLGILSGFVFTVPFIMVFCSLALRFTGMNLIQINAMVFGKIPGGFVSVAYIYYFTILLSFNARSIATLYTTYLMPETPMPFFLIIFITVCAYTVGKGLEVITRLAPICIVFVSVTIISTFVLLIPEMKFSNFLPLFDLPFIKYVQATNASSSIFFGEIVIMIVIMSSLDSKAHVKRNVMLGVLTGLVSLLLAQIRNTAVAGGIEPILITASFEVTRLIDIGDIFTRMDMLIIIAQTVILFFRCSVLYYAISLSLGQLMGLRSYGPLILPVGGIVVVLSMIVFESYAEVGKYASTNIVFVVPFIIFIPLIMLITAKVRHLPEKHREGGA